MIHSLVESLHSLFNKWLITFFFLIYIKNLKKQIHLKKKKYFFLQVL